MRKYLPLLALPALAALLQACTSAPISHHAGQGRCQGTGGAAAPAAEGSRGAGAATAAAAWLQSDLSLLTILSDENFTGALADTEHALVIFYAPYSGHCKVRPCPPPALLPIRAWLAASQNRLTRRSACSRAQPAPVPFARCSALATRSRRRCQTSEAATHTCCWHRCGPAVGEVPIQCTPLRPEMLRRSAELSELGACFKLPRKGR